MGYPIAIQVYSLRKEAEQNLYGTLKKIKAMGYDGVEFAGKYGHTPNEIHEMCEDIGLTPISAHVPYLEMIGDPEKTFADYQTIGVKYVAVPYLTEQHRPGTEAWPEVMENIKMLGSVAKKYGIQLMYHNHDFEFMKIDGKYALDILYENVPADLLTAELDVCWVNVGGENPVDYIAKYNGRIPVIHYKDFYGEKSEDMYELIGINKKAPTRPANFEFRPNGYGKQNFPAILEATKKAGSSWVVVEQDQASMGLTPLECAEKSIQYLKSIGV